MKALAQFIQKNRKELGLTQESLADRAGVGLRFVRDLEQGKKTLRADKIGHILELFGHTLGAIPLSKGTKPK
jgi:y4mF family transcriptional regulator